MIAKKHYKPDYEPHQQIQTLEEVSEPTFFEEEFEDGFLSAPQWWWTGVFVPIIVAWMFNRHHNKKPKDK